MPGVLKVRFKLENYFEPKGYHHLGAESNDTSACEISQAHPADLLYTSKLKIFKEIIFVSRVLIQDLANTVGKLIKFLIFRYQKQKSENFFELF